MGDSIPLEDLKKGADMENTQHSGEPMGVDSYFSSLDFSQDHEYINDYGLQTDTHHQEELRLLAQMGDLDDLHFDIVSPPFQAFEEENTILSSDKPHTSQPYDPQSGCYSFPSLSLGILKSCRSRVAASNGRKVNELFSGSQQQPTPLPQLSTNHIIELAAGNFLHSYAATKNEPSATDHPYASSLLGLSTDNGKDVQLVQDLLSCAEKVGNKQYKCASKLLEEVTKLSSDKISTIQRLVHCFAEALKEKIDRETGRISGEGKFSFNMIAASSATAALQRNLPVTQVAQFTCIQTIMDHLSSSRKLHIIDLEIHCGLLMVILMQELASRSDDPIEHFKITVVATNSISLIEETGIRLKGVAESLKLNFSFHVVMLEDIISQPQNLFHLDADESVIVHAAYALQYMISKPSQLETLMRSIRWTKPRVMIITETESNVNSPIFVNRFVEAFFYFDAFFDCIGDCLKNDTADRMLAESSLFNPVIRNIVATEGEDRNVRTVDINIWRTFFARFGMIETELSKAAINQARLICKKKEFGDSCTLGLRGNCLTLGWKGTPVCSISAWKFHGRRSMRRFGM
ncbi:DELLA protein RGL1-like [Andrographis paniculata]|uniref:DELLA protein RGL1-like n=1 Tax=Andrographis paniculata TaxID=175694 RepID=UPI0021E745DB|nr:DELLA protein RGL1-like [Andrographis paniculata]